MVTVEELTGIVNELADVVKSELSSQHEANRQNIEALAKIVAELAKNSIISSSVDRYARYNEHFHRFLDQLTTFVKIFRSSTFKH